jgi:hypothetical protein
MASHPGFGWQLTARLRTAITLAALAVLMLAGVTWGWGQVSKPFPGKVDAAICVDTAYAAGDQLFVQDVTVNVFNASSREGLAARTLQELEDAGFSPGTTANAPKGTSISAPAEIWVDDISNPAAKLLRHRLGRVPIVEHPENTLAGVTVVVGDQYTELADGPASIVLKDDAVVCSPPVD